MTERDRIAPERADLTDGGGNRRDYGPKGCVGIVYAAALVVVVVVLALVGCKSTGFQPGTGDLPAVTPTPPVSAPQTPAGE